MTALNVLIYPEDHLKVVCDPVVNVNDETRKIIDDMFDTMYQEEGIGLAAPQVDILQRIITIDIEGDKQNQLVLINPEILASEGETGIEEGCLSIPGFRALIPRRKKSPLKHLIAMVMNLRWKQTAYWRFVFNMKSIISTVFCLWIIFLRSNANELKKSSLN